MRRYPSDGASSATATVTHRPAIHTRRSAWSVLDFNRLRNFSKFLTSIKIRAGSRNDWGAGKCVFMIS